MSDKPTSLLNTILSELAKQVLSFAVRAFVVMALWNMVIPLLFTGIPTLAYGHAFVLTLLVATLLGTLNPSFQMQTQELKEIRSLLFKLTSNQIVQNNSILLMLNDILNNGTENVQIVEKVTTEVDKGDDVGYNTQDSENQKQ
jgi:predicted ABC-type exoprotein transport system permease subunit